jgi:sugar phosphate isomerase/epimerase
VPIELSCADYTWPSAPHVLALDIIGGLGFRAVDIGYFAGRSHIRPEAVGDDIAVHAGRLAERCAARGLVIADVFAQPADFETAAVNHPDPAERERSLAFFDRALEFGRLAGSPGMTILPGVIFAGEPWEAAAERAAAGLRVRVERAAAAGLRLSVEPHQGSFIDTPERTARLLEMTPGLTLTLDYGHFVFGGAAEDDIEALLPAAAHVQCRGGRTGVLQADMRANSIDFPRMVRGLVDVGYQGFLAAEYVWAEWHRCNEVDNLTETVALRDLLGKALDDTADRVAPAAV